MESLVQISAGFDAHRKDDVNCGYIGLEEHDYKVRSLACCSSHRANVSNSLSNILWSYCQNILDD